jgi:hypothetical protein
MTVATMSDKCFKIYVCDAHASTVVVMFKNRATDQEQWRKVQFGTKIT